MNQSRISLLEFEWNKFPHFLEWNFSILRLKNIPGVDDSALLEFGQDYGGWKADFLWLRFIITEIRYRWEEYWWLKELKEEARRPKVFTKPKKVTKAVGKKKRGGKRKK